MDGQAVGVAMDMQVVAKPKRRTYTAEYKRRILKEADARATPGAVGALLRREGLVLVAPLVVWRRARDRGELAALAPRKRGRKLTPVDARDGRITELERQLAEMTRRAQRAEALVGAQKNVARCSASLLMGAGVISVRYADLRSRQVRDLPVFRRLNP